VCTFEKILIDHLNSSGAKDVGTFQVVFATPGMLHAGQSLQIFKKWAGNEKNMVSHSTAVDSFLCFVNYTVI